MPDQEIVRETLLADGRESRPAALQNLLQAIPKNGFWFKITADMNFKQDGVAVSAKTA